MTLRNQIFLIFCSFVIVSAVGFFYHATKSHKNGVLIIVALEKELDAKTIPEEFDVIYTGVGKLNVAIATMQGIQKFKPKHVINFGTVGDVKGTFSGILEVSQTLQRDMMPSEPTPRGTTPHYSGEVILYQGIKGLYVGQGIIL